MVNVNLHIDHSLFTIHLLSHGSGFTLLFSIIRKKSICPPFPSSAFPARPITSPVLTWLPLLTDNELRLLYVVKYFPWRIVTIMPSPRFPTKATSPSNTDFTETPADGVAM